eukprot:GHVN01045182.1.p4 GENE.GHVN01045182.1~~GHVN01045182.1.p4  ORF type:complete len:106 (+),score=11.65 GHVN01045182.1:823-1140(+)
MKDALAWTHLTSSVSQGSVLGPLLFIICVYDLCSNLNSTAFQFVDSMKLIHAGDSQLLQADIEKIDAWCNRWLMSLNRNETFVMHFNHYDTQKAPSMHHHSLPCV